MSNAIGLSQYHEDNLRKLAAYLLSGELKAKFDMTWFTEYDGVVEVWATECGTIGCAAGHGPYASINKLPDETWPKYVTRQFGLNGDYWTWAFGSEWRFTDNTASGAAKRIIYMLDNGLPGDWEVMITGRENLCYL